MITGYFDELEVGVVTRSQGRTITETDVVGFAGLSGDFHPLHTDAVYSEQGRFGKRIGHGMLTLAVASGLMTLSATAVQAFYGMDRVRFLKPVYFGDTLTVSSEVHSLDLINDKSGKVTLAVTVLNQSEEPILAFQMIFIVGTTQK